MPRSRGSDLPQRQSPRAPLHLKMTACSEANALHRPAGDRSSPKLEDRRSPRSGPLHEKKRGVKVADLETKLGRAQEELKKLRDQLASAEAAKHDAEEALHKAKKQIPALAHSAKEAEEGKPPPPLDAAEKGTSEHDLSAQATTDVFEVETPSEHGHKEQESNDDQREVAVAKREETEARTEKEENTDAATANGDSEGCETLQEQDAEESQELVDLKAKLLEKEREVEFLLEENAIFKRRAKEEAEKIAAAGRVKEQELATKLSSVEEELKESRAKAEHLGEQLGAAESAKATLEAELKRLKVQTDQWRKAAEAAAAALTNGDGMGGADMGGRKVAERCGSMDKHLGGGYGGWDSPLMAAGDMEDDVAIGGGGRRKSGGIRMFGDLWKKKGQQK